MKNKTDIKRNFKKNTKIKIFSLPFLFLFFLAIFWAGESKAIVCSVKSSCGAGETPVLKMSADNNAHAELVSEAAYSNYICCKESDSSGVLLGASCSGSYDTFLKLNQVTNSHVEKKSEINYSNNICLSANAGGIECDYASNCSLLGSGFSCVAKISGDTNAHIGGCSSSSYSESVCCLYTPPPCGISDGICPSGCSNPPDVDCPAVCGDGFIGGTEVCDVKGPVGCSLPFPMCRADCKACVAPPCGADDGFCPPGCSNPPDSNCPSFCGDGLIGSDERCDVSGDTGCGGLSPKCASDCKKCVCSLASKVTFLGKPIACTIQDLTLFILSVSGSIALFVLIIGGIMYVVSGSNPDMQEKAKKIVMYALFGLIIVLVSYAVIVSMNNLFT